MEPNRTDTLLLVEDDPGIREAVSECLSEEGYCVVGCATGLSALHYLKNNPPPCMILLDLYMPIMSGDEFRSEQLRHAEMANIPTIIVSAASDGETRAASLGVTAFLRKPLNLDQLLDLIETYC